MADSDQMSAIKRLAGQLPVANKRYANQQQAARDLQLQQAAATAPRPTTQVSQQLGTAMAQSAGDTQVKQAQQGIQQAGQVGQAGLAQQATETAQKLSTLQAGAREQQMDNAQRLASISEDAKQEMFDSRRQFASDEAGRKFSNDRQMADYVIQNAKSQQDLANYQQKVAQLSKRQAQATQTALDKITQQMKLENDLMNQAKDQMTQSGITKQQQDSARQLYEQKLAQLQRLQQSEIALKAQLEKNAADAANRATMVNAVFGIGGAALGAGIGGPAGAMVGSSLGSGLGSLITA